MRMAVGKMIHTELWWCTLSRDAFAVVLVEWTNDATLAFTKLEGYTYLIFDAKANVWEVENDQVVGRIQFLALF